MVQSSSAITLDFEDLSGSGALPGNYAGLTWTDWNYYDSYQPPYHASSGAQRIYNQFGVVPTLQFGQDVTFIGAWMAGYGYDQYFEGYNNGVKIFESAHIPSTGMPFGQYFNLNWVGVDEIRIQSWSGNYYIIDDLQYRTDLQPSGVPDAGSTLLLLGSALSVLGVVRRRSA
ncbi:MAG TPA: VPDSG-CTERM sorting domain-containing protein [Methylomirabilota bacterium]|nr:VPDSG-CTERM sorting domain-containing protein [Methylomirabilota bacterium]